MTLRVLLFLPLIAVVAAGGEGRRSTGPAPLPAPVPAAGFEAFAVIGERNIFNPNRTGRSRVVPEEKPARMEEVGLVGVVRYEREALAVFQSPDPRLRGEFGAGGRLGDFTVAAVSATGAELTAGERRFVVPVGQRLTRTEGGEWTLSAPAAPLVDSAARAAAAPVEIPANASEVLKRLMKQREKQLK